MRRGVKISYRDRCATALKISLAGYEHGAIAERLGVPVRQIPRMVFDGKTSSVSHRVPSSQENAG